MKNGMLEVEYAKKLKTLVNIYQSPRGKKHKKLKSSNKWFASTHMHYTTAWVVQKLVKLPSVWWLSALNFTQMDYAWTQRTLSASQFHVCWIFYCLKCNRKCAVWCPKYPCSEIKNRSSAMALISVLMFSESEISTVLDWAYRFSDSSPLTPNKIKEILPSYM